MTIQLHSLEDSKVLAYVDLDSKTVAEKITESVKKVANLITVPGFRKGKAPDHIVRLKFKKQIEQMAMSALVEEARDQLEFETHLKYLGQAEFKSGQLHDTTFWCELLFHKIPDFELKQYKDFELTQLDEKKVVEELIDQELKKLQEKHAEQIEVTDMDPIEIGYDVDITFKMNGIQPQYLRNFNTKNEIIASGFTKEVLKMKVGEPKDFSLIGDILTTEEEFGKKLFGQKIEFKAIVVRAIKHTLHPLNDSLAEKVGYSLMDTPYTPAEFKIKDGDKLEHMIVCMKLQAKDQFKIENLKYLANQIVFNLLKSTEIELPTWLVQFATSKVLENYQITESWEKVPEDIKKEVLEVAHNDAKLDLILRVIREKEPEAVFSDQEIIGFIKKQKLKEILSKNEKFKQFNDIITKEVNIGTHQLKVVDEQNKLIKMAFNQVDQELQQDQKSGKLATLAHSFKNETTIQWLIEHCRITNE